MSVAVTSDHSIRVGWTVPPVVLAQLTADDIYTIAVIPDCKNGQNEGIQPFFRMTLAYYANASTEFFGLGKS